MVPRPETETRGGGAPIAVAVCVATFRRPRYLQSTLESLAGLRFEKCTAPDLKVVVVDNDAERSAEATVEAARASFPWPIRYVIERERGIAHARNRLVREAGDVDAVAFIDDDETAEPQWMDELLFHFGASDAAAVLGPVISEFETPPEPWLVRFFERPDHPDGAAVGAEDFRCGNVLIRSRAIAEIRPPFEEEFSRTGGEDSLLGRTLQARGERFVWARRAIIHETTPASRSNPTWVLRRQFRAATTLTAIRLKMHGRARGAAYALWRAAGAAALGSISLTGGVLRGRAARFRGLGLWATAVGNAAGVLGFAFREYEETHGR